MTQGRFSNIIVNKHARLNISDYDETTAPEATSRCMDEHENDLVEWVSYGTIAGLKARGYYHTTPDDSKQFEAQGCFDCINWKYRLWRVEIITDDNVEVCRVYNPEYDIEK